MLISEAFEPNYGLFSVTKLNHFYPSATSSVQGRNHIQLFEFIGKVNIKHRDGFHLYLHLDLNELGYWKSCLRRCLVGCSICWVFIS